MSTIEENKSLVRRFFEEWNKGNPDSLLELVAPDAVEHNLPAGVPQGHEGIKKELMMFMQAFPDMHFIIEDMIAEGDKVVCRITNTGTHKGEFMGLPATGKTMTITGIEIYRVANGKLVEHWGNQDDLGRLQQLGVIPIPGEAPAPA